MMRPILFGLTLTLSSCAFIPYDTSLVDGKKTIQPQKNGKRWIFANGEYEGEIRNGQPQGVGVFFLRDGRRIEAYFEHGIARAGKIKAADGSLLFEGEFQDAAPPARLKFSLSDGEFVGLSFAGQRTEGEFSTRRGETFRFASPLEQGKPHGLATLTDAQGNIQHQPFKSGQREGTGDYIPKSGMKWTQYWRNDRLIYQHPDSEFMRAHATNCAVPFGGTWYLAQGECPSGQLGSKSRLYAVNGKVRIDGETTAPDEFKGEYFLFDGNKRWVGTFSNGRINGQIRYFRDGVLEYDGPAVNGNFEGIGQCRHDQGMEFCEYRAGKRIDEIYQTRQEIARLEAESARLENERRQAEEAREQRRREAEERRREERRERERAEEAERNRRMWANINRSIQKAGEDVIASTRVMPADPGVSYTMPAAKRAEIERKVQQESQQKIAALEAEQRKKQAEIDQRQRQLQNQSSSTQRKQEEDRQKQLAVQKREEEKQAEQRRAEEEKRRLEEERRLAEQQRAEEKTRKEEEKRKAAEDAKQARWQYLQMMTSGTRLRARTCPDGEGKYYVVGTRPRPKPEVVSCVDVYFQARCPGMVTGTSGVAKNFTGMATDCFMGDTVVIDPKPNCKVGDVNVVVKEVRACGE
jgi:hypothetical protein